MLYNWHWNLEQRTGVLGAPGHFPLALAWALLVFSANDEDDDSRHFGKRLVVGLKVGSLEVWKVGSQTTNILSTGQVLPNFCCQWKRSKFLSQPIVEQIKTESKAITRCHYSTAIYLMRCPALQYIALVY